MPTEFMELFNWVAAQGWRAVDFLVKFVTSPSIQQDYFKLGLILAITFLLEVAARKNWRFRYGSKNFRVDLLYFVFYYGGIYHLFLWTVMYKAMIAFTTAHAPWLQMNLLSGMSPVWQVIVMVLVSDFVGYWSHRWRHSSKTSLEFSQHPPFADQSDDRQQLPISRRRRDPAAILAVHSFPDPRYRAGALAVAGPDHGVDPVCAAFRVEMDVWASRVHFRQSRFPSQTSLHG